MWLPQFHQLDGCLGNSLRTLAASEHLFEDVDSWKPWLIVAYLTDWTPGVSELWSWSEDNAQKDLRFSSGIHSTPRCRCSLVTSRRDSIWSTELWMVGLQTPQETARFLAGCDDDSLRWTIDWVCAARSVCIPGCTSTENRGTKWQVLHVPALQFAHQNPS